MLITGDRPPAIPCPCGSTRPLSDCCYPYVKSWQPAPTAEALMRSRYVAYCLKQIDYLVTTHHPSRRHPNSHTLIAATAHSTQWVGLNILATTAGQTTDTTGTVKFVARYREGKQIGQLHERSQFIKEQGKWFYLDGEILPPVITKKNDPCWCQSGKTFKQCHGKKR